MWPLFALPSPDRLAQSLNDWANAKPANSLLTDVSHKRIRRPGAINTCSDRGQRSVGTLVAISGAAIARLFGSVRLKVAATATPI